MRSCGISISCLVALVVATGDVRAQIQVTTPAPGISLAWGVNGGNPTALAVVNLCAPGVSVRTTRYEERGALAADWAARTGVDLAINGDLFDYGSYSVAHWARSGGADWPAGTHNQEPHPNIAFGAGFALRGDLPPMAAATDIVGGIPEFVIDGMTSTTLPDTDFVQGPHRRTAVGLSRDRRTLFLFSTDGTGSVPGIHFAMAVFAAAVPGAPRVWWALNLDGGGSSQMWVRGRGVVIPSSRPVANHLGIFARGSGASPHCPAREPRCPASGVVQACLDRTRIGDCVEGVLTGGGDCGAYGAVCAPARPGGPGCVIAFCLPDASRAPFDHDACGFDGRLTHCRADGQFDNPRTCPTGTTCQMRSDGVGACVSPPPSLDASLDAVVDASRDVVTDARAVGDASFGADVRQDAGMDAVDVSQMPDATTGYGDLHGGCGCGVTAPGRRWAPCALLTAVVCARRRRRGVVLRR